QFYGTIFRITTGGALATLYTLNYTDGSYPHAGLIEGSDGNFYGTTFGGGANSNGTLFRITPSGQITTLVSFDGFDDGAQPQAALVQAADRNFYGTTSTSGPGGHGTVFRFSVLFPPVFQNVTSTNGMVTLTWSAVGGVKYQPQYKTNAAGTNWINLGKVLIATSAQASVSDFITPDPQRFYRIVLLP
ncbi:MAG TPA: choice-of-anchor tandem repeat GloVer-containing protein, partial [Verrucomicrobiae bacterium]|nr:choice-of-anchor tandem repeat GloVer-containing protein [Verrucomicrobiae bacterium]